MTEKKFIGEGWQLWILRRKNHKNYLFTLSSGMKREMWTEPKQALHFIFSSSKSPSNGAQKSQRKTLTFRTWCLTHFYGFAASIVFSPAELFVASWGHLFGQKVLTNKKTFRFYLAHLTLIWFDLFINHDKNGEVANETCRFGKQMKVHCFPFCPTFRQLLRFSPIMRVDLRDAIRGPVC